MAHSHSHFEGSEGWLLFALTITAALVATEFVAGSAGHSLSLVSDGWHNLSDMPSLFFAWIAVRYQHRPANHKKTFGYQRAGVLAAFTNALILLAVACVIGWEGYGRLRRPAHVASGAMIVVGIIALVINGTITLGMLRGRNDINIRAIFVHNLGDAASNAAIIAAAIIIRITGFVEADPLLAILIAIAIFWGGIGILRESADILLESLPEGMSIGNVAGAMLDVPGVQEVHDVHIWSLNPHSHAIACHIRTIDMPTSESEIIIRSVQNMLAERFGISHCTVQVEHTHPPGEFHTYMPEPARARPGRKP
ncbi:MAG: cation transporter [Acidobacteriota bacterium]|nr:cation transporter [Acidobacteriota bacterium]